MQSPVLILGTPRRLGHRTAVLDALLCQLQPVIGLRKLQAKLAERPLPGQAAILGRLHRVPACLELLLGDPGLLASLDEAPLQRLGLGRGAPVRVASLAPLLPHDAAPQELEASAGLADATPYPAELS